MARALDALGVDIIEAGFPIASPADAEAVRADRARGAAPGHRRAGPLPRSQDIEEAARALAPAERSRIHTFLATSDLHLERKLRMTREACLEAVVDGVRRARQFTDDVEFSAEDATRSDRDFLCRVIEAAIRARRDDDQPARHGRLRDAGRDPRVLRRDHRARVPNADKAVFSAHCHDDLGLAVANSLAAIQGGVRQVECTINGIGERAGNASLEEIVMALRVRQRSAAVRHGDQVAALFETSQLLSQLTDEPVQANKAIVGRNAFAHEAGIHQDGVLKDPRTYEIMRPQDVGQPPDAARARPPLRAPRRAAALRDARPRAHRTTSSSRSTTPSSRSASTARPIGDGDLRRIVERLRGSGPAAPDDANGGHHVEHVGYGHGV